MKTSKDYEQEFLAAIKEKTGKDLDQWMKILKTTSLTKNKETLNWLKKEHGLNHMNANFLTGIFLNNGKPVFADSGNLKDALFKGKENLIPIYEELEKHIKKIFKNVEIVPTKTYISFRENREFAVASIKSKEIRVGMDLGDKKYDDYVLKSVSLGAMPRISHMIIVTDKKQIDNDLTKNLKESYKRVVK